MADLESDPIPPEVRAAVASNEFFAAVRLGDYPAAARAQDRLRELGWDVRRASDKAARRPTPRQAARREGGDR